MEIWNYNTLIEAVLILLIYLYWKFIPNNGEMYLKVRKLEKICAKLSEMLEVDRMEMWEHIEGTLKPLTARMSTRIRRAEKSEAEDLNKSESLKKGGIIKQSELKYHGINR